MSEQLAEQSSGEPGSLHAGPDVPHSQGAQGAPVAASVQEPESPESVDSPQIAPDHEAPKTDAPKAEAPKVEASEPAAPHMPGKLMIMSPGDRSWDGDKSGTKAETEPASGMFGKRRFAALAAVAALATIMGALGGALATAGYARFVGGVEQASNNNGALEATVARIDADILALKASVENTAKLGMSQYNKTSDRLDRVEKAQVEPAAKLARLSEAVDKLRAASQAATVAAAAPAPAKEVTGSIAPPANALPGAASAAKTEVGRLPTVEGWVLRDVSHGGALIEGRQGIYEVYAGDPVPGLGRVDAIRRQDGRWVVVTTKGLVVAR
ncbi:hypothetical protein SAMN05444159_2513 [Bradyrhizobium lablabi]|uniref:Uncharacterized protein n=1 Tax=Bradyrhizobium lablabi TaxID=722472 RepID=A0A1M6Q048_9BRAD|nr:hypothetical protein [Bradyrhizobium lablabi]SHK13531.1 hypothetical protein SAMN05444159_2513 [Bradyrhizobium lablabi]